MSLRLDLFKRNENEITRQGQSFISGFYKQLLHQSNKQTYFKEMRCSYRFTFKTETLKNIVDEDKKHLSIIIST